MKQVYFIIAMLCGLALGGQAQGIRFAEGSWKELLETAKKEGKLIFGASLVSKWNSRFFRRKKWGSFTMSIL